MKSMISIALVICLLGSISGCGGYGSSNQTAGLLAGTWQFTYVSATNGSSTVSGTLTQTGNNFTGTVTITNSCVASGMITGTLSGYSLTGTITETSPETISVTGTVATGGGSASGTYQVISATGACAAASGDSGTWSGTRTSVPVGPYSGMVRSADRIPVQLALNLKGDASHLSGMATFTNSACLHSMNVTGTLTGTNLELKGDAGEGGSMVLTGTTDIEGKVLTLTSTVSGACQAESGAATLTKLQ